ncbi:SDR family oxidoreductase [Pectobacteriaceae bacterium C52]|nr:SDR family oxidoreductase [Pectobacteriaceae bacterium C52]
MSNANLRVVITGAGRELGRSLAIRYAKSGAEVLLSARNIEAAEKVRYELQTCGCTRVHAFACDLSDPASIRAFAQAVENKFGHVDVLINNGSPWAEGQELDAASDEEITNVIMSCTAGTVLMIKHFLPLLRQSERPDIVNIISSSAHPLTHDCEGHAAFYAAKAGQGRMAETLSLRLREEGIRVISLYPPKFDNSDPLVGDGQVSRTSKDRLTSESLIDCIQFAVNMPRDCFIRRFDFESV